MDDRGRRPSLRRRSFQQLVVLLAAWACVSGCVGPKAVRYTRMRYHEVLRDTNDVPNAPGATILTPRVADDNSLYIRGIRLLASLRTRDATELAFGTEEETEGSSDPIPRGSVQGSDLLNAARDGYVYRSQGEGQ